MRGQVVATGPGLDNSNHDEREEEGDTVFSASTPAPRSSSRVTDAHPARERTARRRRGLSPNHSSDPDGKPPPGGLLCVWARRSLRASYPPSSHARARSRPTCSRPFQARRRLSVEQRPDRLDAGTKAAGGFLRRVSRPLPGRSVPRRSSRWWARSCPRAHRPRGRWSPAAPAAAVASGSPAQGGAGRRYRQADTWTDNRHTFTADERDGAQVLPSRAAAKAAQTGCRTS